ncbi:MAG: dihydroorotate dehydrogenase [Gammaproteobacteria bacterium]|jgi:dihydroorotate dehydrogenase (NAD+) catalytic subunit
MNLETTIGKIKFKNPIWVASGTFRYGEEFADFLDLSKIGAIITKTVTLEPRKGNPPPRLVETAAGLLNSIGLENKGAANFKTKHFNRLKNIDTKIIVNIAGTSAEEFAECAEILAENNFPHAFELNLSCPNVQHKQSKYRLLAQDPNLTEQIVASVKKKVKQPIIVKLTPNVTDIAEIAYAAEQGGADAVSLVNTYIGMAVDVHAMKPLLGNIIGGLSGPAIKPLALRAVWEVYKKVSIPIIGIGGIMSGIDVAEFMLCGASAVQIGTANLLNPQAYDKISAEFFDYLQTKKITSLDQIVGKLSD